MSQTDAPTPAWWEHAVIYQIYVRSFADADGDGIGDLAGIRSRLPYVADLGVDAIWLNPFYPSPQADAGYDVANYRDVDPRFGTLADADALVAEAHELGLRVLVDLVPNHTSDQHRWFQDALAAAPDSPERARYIFRPGRGPDGDRPPNDWRSQFGGPAWTRITEADGTPGPWYLHLFAREQPDLDWTNPEVRAEFRDILRFWLDRGVDGFRIDVAHGLAKDPAMPDLDGRAFSGMAEANHPHWDRDEVHDVYREWREVIDAYDGDRTFVGEAWVQSPERRALYVRSDELHTVFNFGFLLAPWDAKGMRDAIDESLESFGAVGAPSTWVLSNHDVVRHVTRYGCGEIGTRRARAATLLMLGLPGGAYVYQGEELGLEEVVDLPDEVREDPTFHRTNGEEKGRDGCRVPIPWSGDEQPFGFGPGGSWLPQPDHWAELTAAHEAGDPDSMLELYRSALRLRRELPKDPHVPALEWVDTGDEAVLAFRRGSGYACVVNLGDTPAAAPAAIAALGDPVLASTPLVDGRLPADAAAWYLAR
ncbi:MAG: glycoside hydrolase family 13 protein [Actinomycetota bacterium]|nr:glycoside hydrolase family 13 protein [Actinomycetota bacterium]